MSEQAAPAPPEQKSRFSLPSAYTILFALIVLAAIATWVIPAGVYNLNELGETIPAGTYLRWVWPLRALLTGLSIVVLAISAAL
jgi:uncharacterized ion transporter superfamily protein YfcC